MRQSSGPLMVPMFQSTTAMRGACGCDSAFSAVPPLSASITSKPRTPRGLPRTLRVTPSSSTKSTRLGTPGSIAPLPSAPTGELSYRRCIVPADADRDLFFQDSHLVGGWGFAPATLPRLREKSANRLGLVVGVPP